MRNHEKQKPKQCGSHKEFDIIPNPEPCLSEKVMETIPYCSMKRSAFSKKEGLPSITSRAIWAYQPPKTLQVFDLFLKKVSIHIG